MHKPLIQHNSWQIKKTKQSEIWRNTTKLIQALTFKLNINEWFKYEKGANLFNNPSQQNKISNPLPPSKGFSKIFNPSKMEGVVVHAMQIVWVKLKKVRTNSLSKPDQSKGCYIKAKTSQENNNPYVYIHCSVPNKINLQSPKLLKNIMQHRFRIGESFSNHK